MAQSHNQYQKMGGTNLPTSGAIFKNVNGHNSFGWGPSSGLPSEACGWAVGALYITEAGLYVNTGSTSSCTFSAVANAVNVAELVLAVDPNFRMATLEVAENALTLSAANNGSLVLLNTADVVTLPEAADADGCYFRFLAQTVETTAPQIDPDGEEVINLQGTDLTGGYYAEADAIGDTLTLYSDGAKWWTIESSGTWGAET